MQLERISGAKLQNVAEQFSIFIVRSWLASRSDARAVEPPTLTVTHKLLDPMASMDTQFPLSPPHAPSIFKSRRPLELPLHLRSAATSERDRGKISTTSRLIDSHTKPIAVKYRPTKRVLWDWSLGNQSQSSNNRSWSLGSPIPTPTDFFLDCCVSCSARDAVSELPRGVHEQEGVRFGEVGILPLQLARRRTPCVCFVALPATQPGMLFPSLFPLLNYSITITLPSALAWFQTGEA